MVSIKGKQYKSIRFSVLRDQLVSRKKKQTFRCLFFPSFVEGDTVAIMFGKEFLYFATITDMYCKRICEINLEEAIADGFNSVNEFQKGLMKINHIKSNRRWGIIIKYEEIKIENNVLSNLDSFIDQ